MLRVVQRHKDANKEDLASSVLNVSLGQIDLHKLSILKGQIYAFEAILEIKEFLKEIVTEEVKSEV